MLLLLIKRSSVAALLEALLARILLDISSRVCFIIKVLPVSTRTIDGISITTPATTTVVTAVTTVASTTRVHFEP